MPNLRNPTFWRIPAGAVLALGVALGVHEGDKRNVYLDVNGVPTACKGVTGPTIKLGQTYTADECRALESAYIARMADNMGHCINAPLTFGEWVGFGSFAYNIGTTGFCHSKIPGLLRLGEHTAACNRMLRYVYVGGRDCRIRANNCYGIVTRRKSEVATCLS